MQVNFQSEQNRMLYVTLKMHVLGAGEMMQWVKCLLLKELSLNVHWSLKKKMQAWWQILGLGKIQVGSGNSWSPRLTVRTTSDLGISFIIHGSEKTTLWNVGSLLLPLPGWVPGLDLGHQAPVASAFSN